MGTYNNFYKINSVDLIDVFYPVGTIYETKNSSFDPNVAWGGTWVRIKDKFLMASGDTYTGTGGSATVTLQEANLPSHSHSFTPSGSISVATDPTFTGSEVTSAAGSKHSHTRGTMQISGSISLGGVEPMRTKSASGIFSNGSDGSANTYGGGHAGGAQVVLYATGSNNWSGSTSEESSHTHSVTAAGSISGGSYSFTGTAGTTGTKGNGTPIDILPPYDTVFVWERTA